jgi:hypothetical protein
MASSRILPVISPEILAAMHTGSLLRRMRDLWKCEESAALSDRADLNTPPSQGEGIEFKNTDAWRQAHAELKTILSRRPHLPKASERLLKRTLRAKKNRSREKRQRLST